MPKVKMDSEEVEIKKDYKFKMNNFADWFTAVIISTFAYLIGFGTRAKVEELLQGKAYLWDWSFYSSSAALIFIFVIKVFGVFAAKIRVEKGLNDCQHCIESLRDIFSIVFVVFGIMSLIATGLILKFRFNLL